MAETSIYFFFSSRRRHTRYWRDLEFRRVLFRSQRYLQVAAEAPPDTRLGQFSGSLLAAVESQLGQQRETVGRFLAPYARNGALCAPIAVVVPRDAQVIGYRLLARDALGEFAPCQPGLDCTIGWSKPQAAPLGQQSAFSQPGTTAFMIWSHNRQRWARMIIFYTLPQGQRPLTQM